MKEFYTLLSKLIALFQAPKPHFTAKNLTVQACKDRFKSGTEIQPAIESRHVKARQIDLCTLQT